MNRRITWTRKIEDVDTEDGCGSILVFGILDENDLTASVELKILDSAGTEIKDSTVVYYKSMREDYNEQDMLSFLEDERIKFYEMREEEIEYLADYERSMEEIYG